MAEATEKAPPKTPQSMSGTSTSEAEKQPASAPPPDDGKDSAHCLQHLHLTKPTKSLTHGKSKKEPAGGYDSTPIPVGPPGWTVKITFNRATNLPMADLNSFSSDPYVLAQLNISLPQRHKEDPPLTFRTHTIRRKTDPVWNSEWIIANVPSSGFKLKARVMDEDPADHDDRLGNAHISVDHINEDYPGIKEQHYAIKKRMGSKRAYVIRAISTCLGNSPHMHGELIMSVEVLGRTKDESGGRAYTVGPCWWVKHYSPMLGRMTGMKEERESKPEEAPKDQSEKQGEGAGAEAEPKKKKKSSAQRYNFQANQMQLPGPVPAELYHRYVEFKPFVKGMFTRSGPRGYLFNKALHHQHARVYNYDRSTVWGYVPVNDPQAITKRFLELVHYDRGGRIFTYVLTLDGQFRFTETGKEFGIDMLSKHSMHSDVEAYIAFSGEFFLRRYRPSSHRKKSSGSSLRPSSPSPSGKSRSSSPMKAHHKLKPSTSSSKHLSPDPSKPVADADPSVSDDEEAASNANETAGGQVNPTTPVAYETGDDGVPLDPSEYELIIDNDSGTYRPAAHLLPLLRTFFNRSFPGLHVRTLDCQKDADRMGKLKDEQRERKKKSQGGATVVFTQRSRSSSFASSVSSSDEEELDRIEGTGERRFREQVARDLEWKAKKRVEHWRNVDPRRSRPDGEGPGGQEVVGEKSTQPQEEVGKDEKGEKGEEVEGGEKEKEKIEKEEIDKEHVGSEQGVDLTRRGTAMNQGQTIGTSDRHPEHHVVTKGEEEGDGQAKKGE
ncbi:hypothetical protein KVT40_008767 [Elsinoe batatas]|uniref:C2 domain-containing protein n=1 Tax=Elsinoe batatas TaxID=2601811 RepID=A0A8K0PBU4_9PEZI|nr:hypothetical protein KVT40_008767 [Elsinoe batatas]